MGGSAAGNIFPSDYSGRLTDEELGLEERSSSTPVDLNALADDLLADSEGDDGMEGFDMAALEDMLKSQGLDGGVGGASGYAPETPGPTSGEGEGYSWTSDEGKVYVRIAIPKALKAKAIQVDISPEALRVMRGKEGELLVGGPLAGRCRPDSSFWTIEEDEDEDSEIKWLCVDLEKDTKGGNWKSGLLVGECDPFRATVTDTAWLELALNGTSLGRLEVGLLGLAAPRTALNFKELCKGDAKSTVDPGRNLSLKGSPFHRIIPGFMLQGGDITNGDGTGGESIYGPKFDDENFSLKHTAPGVLSMANSGPDTCGSQFFVTTAPTPWLDGRHCVFGRVTGGFEKVALAVEKCGSETGQVTGEVIIADCGVL